ncbi:hypothetical protein [Burkholderia pseudomultivorans]|uniref:Uncharacterized protein n=1 Tax=Burkholderia pseudomultivorans TaxID=1207504 RepID=A0ABU2DX39_9BURK|nr:hypothetical protein [Burkholderia pseudomultivorans]MDR8726432.1 hypothetical protein [Burkholderia pseudomultivorans]MDR8733656.1 hypothetical protein [Burkholderia pseudomultivorans]MDR8740182.1 hypothetical protein [Burkholderia pseudomultivorans]MDR8752150.1 hypothetical protein [Burkholderia pseudomultivorans]MDR8776545.1 hypothetical protein [Burkholderia pseudomultivorans]
MRFRSSMAAGALALMPVFAIAGQADAAPAAQPMFVNVNGQAVPVKAETRTVQTAVGPMKVSTWSWRSPHGGASFEMQTATSSGGMPPEAAMRQMQAARYQMQAAQAQMIAMQQQMIALQHIALANAFAMPMPQPVGFAVPAWAMPEPVVVIVPARPAARSAAPTVPNAPAVPATRGPEIKA